VSSSEKPASESLSRPITAWRSVMESTREARSPLPM